MIKYDNKMLKHTIKKSNTKKENTLKPTLKLTLKPKLQVITTLIFTLLLSACSTSMKLADSAVDKNWDGTPPKKVMIIGLAERRYRTPFESAFVDELRSRGYDAVTSTAYAPVLADLDDENKIEDIIKLSNVDSAMTVKATGFREPNNNAWAVAYVASMLFAENRQEAKGMRALVAGAALADNVAAAHYGLEIQFFDVKSDRLIWTAKTKTFDAGDMDDMVILLADLIINDLAAKGVI